MFTDVKKLQTFVAIVEEGSFTGAAERLNIAQPWVSVQLKQLEEMLGLTLMDRQKGKIVRLSAEGREFLKIAEKMLAACHEATGEFGALRDRNRKNLVLGVDPITLYMPGRNELITRFMERNKGVDLQIVSRTPGELFTGLRNLEFDLILTSQPCPIDDVDVLPLYEYDLRLMVPKAGEHLYEASTRGSLENAQILTLPDSYHPPLYAWLKSALAPSKVRWMQCPEDSFPALIRYASMLGIAVLTPDFGDRSPALQGDLELRPVADIPLTVNWGLMRRGGFCKRTAESFWRMAADSVIDTAAPPERVAA